MPNYETELLKEKIIIPKMCPCCGKYENNSTHIFSDTADGRVEQVGCGTLGSKRYHRHVSFFYCKPCIQHSEKYHDKRKYLVFLIPILFLFFVFVYYRLPFVKPAEESDMTVPILFLILLLGSIILFLIKNLNNHQEAKKMIGENCVNPDWAVTMSLFGPQHSSDDQLTMKFDFNNKAYAIQFATENNIKVREGHTFYFKKYY